jgi:hypothetical protein
LDNLLRERNKEEEFIISAKVLYLMGCGRMIKRHKELLSYLTEIHFEAFLKTILDTRVFTTIKTEIFMRDFGETM